MSSKIYVATIPLKYEVMACATTESEAMSLAAKFAYNHLMEIGAIIESTETPEKLLEYFGCCVTELDIGSATFA
jgi:hypothetical protein